MHACMIHMLTTRLAPHDRLMCSLGRSKAVELAYNGYQWLYKSWVVAFDGSACRGAMASIALPHVSTENDRQINLSQRVLSTCCERSTFASLYSRASRAFRESSSASETDSGCTIADKVAEGRLAAGFIRIL